MQSAFKFYYAIKDNIFIYYRLLLRMSDLKRVVMLKVLRLAFGKVCNSMQCDISITSKGDQA